MHITHVHANQCARELTNDSLVHEFTHANTNTGHKVQVFNSSGRWEDAEIISSLSATEIWVKITRDEISEVFHVNHVRHYRLIHNASWSLETEKMVLTFASDVPDRTPVRISVGTYGFGGLKIPANGITSNAAASWNIPVSDFGWITAGTSPFSISTNAVDGPVLEMPIERVESVIAFLDTRLVFHPFSVAGETFAIGGQAAGFDLFFAVGEQLGPGDQLFMNLPSFQRKCRTEPPPFTCQESDNLIVPTNVHEVESVNLRPISNFPFLGPKRAIDIFWSDVDKRFRLNILEPINYAEELKFTISANLEFKFVIPQEGVRCQDTLGNPTCRYVNPLQRHLRQPQISLSAIALRGMVDLNEVQMVSPLGSFFPPAEISLTPAVRGEPTNLKLILVPTMDVHPDESFYLYLPEFVRDADIQRRSGGVVGAQFLTIETESTAEFALSWDDESIPPKLIILLVGGNITAGESTILTISVAAGILIPMSGLSPDAVLTISSDAYDGPVLHQPVKFPPVGSLGSALGIRFDPPIAGHVTAITFNFQAVLGILQGESCLMSLPGFVRRDDSGFDYTANLPRNSTLIPGFSNTDGHNPNYDITWEVNKGEPAIRFTAKEDSNAFHSISISHENWIRVPEAGISALSKPISVICNTTNGNVPETEVPPEAYIGIFPPGSSLSFHPASSGQPTQMGIRIVYSADIAPGDIFSWYLPGFFKSTAGENQKPVLSGPDYLKVGASWNANTEVLNLQALEPMEIDHVLTVTVMAYRGLSLPKMGIRKIGHGIQLATNAKGGAVLPVDMRPGDVQVVGAFITSHLDFDPPRAGMPAVVGFSFSTAMKIQIGETIHFNLRGFEALDLTSKDLSTGVLDANPAVVRLQRDAEQSMTVVQYNVSDPIMPGELVRVTASDVDSLIKLPFDGVLSGHSSLTISCNAEEGPVEAEPIQTWQLVGSFTNSPRLSLPLTTDASTSLVMQIAFVPKMRIDVGEPLTFHLPGFRGPQQTIGLSAYPPSSFTEAYWDPSTGDLLVMASQVVEPNAEVEMNLLSSTLLLPIEGIPAGAQGFTIAASVAAGPVLPTPIVAVHEMGMMYNSRMSFGNPRPGEASSLTIQFQLRNPIVPGDMVQVGLPGMFLPPSHQTRFFTESANWGQAEWVLLPPNGLPALNLLSTLTASGSSFTIFIPSIVGIHLPVKGIVLNQNEFFIRSFAESASIISTPFVSIQAVGSFSDSTKLVLQDPRVTYAGKHAYFTVSFVPEMTIAKGEYVRIHLPGFERLPSQNLVYSLDGTFDAVNNFADSTISLMAVRNVAPQESLNVNVTGLLMPAKGIRLVQDEIRISSNSYLGPIPAVPIHSVPTVGALMTSNLQFGKQMADTISSVQFSMTPAMQLGCSEQQLASDQCEQEMTQIYLYLPSFSRKTSGPFPDCGGLDDCSWSEATHTLTLFCSWHIQPEEMLSFTIPESGKLTTPPSGVLVNDERFTVSVRTAYGNVEPTSIQETMGIGAFKQTSISFSRGPGALASAGEPALIEIGFTYVYTRLLLDDEIVLSLPGFTLDDANYASMQPAGSFQVTWTALDETIQAVASWQESADRTEMVLTVPKSLAAREQMHVKIDMAVGIRCPSVGSPPNNAALTISTEKTVGPVPEIAFEQSTAVGAFFHSAIVFRGARAASDTAVTVTLSPTMDIISEEVFDISLPLFSGPGTIWVQEATDSANFTMTVQECSICSVQPTTQIRVVVGLPIRKQSVFSFTIPEFVGIRIPVSGVAVDQIGPTVRTNARDGPVSDVSFIQVRPIGVFILSELSFEPLSTFEPVTLDLKLTLSAATALTQGDTLELLLPGFRGMSTDGILGSVPEGYVTSFSWNSTSRILRATVARMISPEETFQLRVSASSGIQLPEVGLAADTPAILLSTRSDTGPVPPTTLSSIMGVHALTMLQLTYGTPVPLQQSSLVLKFALTQNFLKDETVTLVLPGFRATPGPVVLDEHANFANVGAWHQGSEDNLKPQDANEAGHECVECNGGTPCFASRISFTVIAEIPANTAITLSVASGWVRLPSTGLQEDDKTIKFRAANKYGQLLASASVDQSMKVTSLILNMGLKLPIAWAGRISPVVAQFDVMSFLSAGTSIIISLPHFQGDEEWQVHCYRRVPSADCVYFQEHAVYDAKYARFVTRINQAAQPVTSTSTPLSLPNAAPATNSNFIAIWQPKSKEIRLTAVSDIEPCQISITVPTTSGIRVPVAGLQAETNQITVAFSVPLMDFKTATRTSVVTSKMSVDDVTQVGALFYDSRIKFIHAEDALRAPIAIEVGLSLTAGLGVADTISIILPSFGAPMIPALNTTKSESHFSAESARFTARWNSVQEELVLTVVDGSTSQGKISFTVPSEWGILLPSVGVHMESGVMIRVTESASGAELRSKFESQHLLGSFVRTSLTMATWQPASGLHWRSVGVIAPSEGRSRVNVGLAIKLKSKTEFTQEEWDAFGLSDLRIDDYIKSVSTYFTPAEFAKQGQVRFGESVAVNLSFALSVPLMTGESVVVTLTGLESLSAFPTDLQPDETEVLLPTFDALLPSRGPNCLATVVEKKLLTSGVFQRTQSCKDQDCACNWYGPACDLYCEDLHTCNGNGFCTGYGSCTCFLPFYGPFCNRTSAVVNAGAKGCQVEPDDALQVQSTPSAAGSTSVAVEWTASPPSLTFSVVSSQPLAAWTALSYSIPKSYGLVVSNAGAASAEFGASILSTSSSDSLRGIVATTFHRPKCYSKPLIVSADSGSMCAGVNPVRICATSDSAAQVTEIIVRTDNNKHTMLRKLVELTWWICEQEYIDAYIKPLLENVRAASCSERLEHACDGASSSDLDKVGKFFKSD